MIPLWLRTLPAAWILLAAPLCALSAEPAAALQNQFVRAQQAYDEGRVQEAITLYEHILSQGYYAHELFYNLGNAHYRSGDIGSAALNYRRAQYLKPRDEDTRYNLYYILQRAGAIHGAPSRFERLWFTLSRNEWMALAVALYWLTAGLLAYATLTYNWRATVLRALAMGVALIALSVSGIWYWTSLERRPEVVVLEPGQEALFGPLEGSTAHYAVPEGSIARVTGDSDIWYRIEVDGQTGWIRKDVCEPVDLAQIGRTRLSRR